LFLSLLPVLWWRRARAAMGSTAGRRPALAIAALGGIGFATVYYIDLGFPLDYDLMVSMCMPVNLCLLQWVARAPRRARAAAAAGLIAGGCYTWTVMAALLVHDAGPHPLGRAGLGSAPVPGLLTANGRSTEVSVRSGEAVLLELWPPATLAVPATFSILGYHGVPPAGDDARQNGDRALCFPDPTSPRWDPARVFFVIDVQQIGALGITSPPLTRHWTSGPVRLSAALGVTTVQALLHDAAGREFTSNAVIVRPLH
jgi:hypothetical protein